MCRGVMDTVNSYRFVLSRHAPVFSTVDIPVCTVLQTYFFNSVDLS